MVGRQNRFKRGERIESLALADVERPRKSFTRGLFHFVLERFREQKFVGDKRRIKRNAGNGFGDANHAAVFAQDGGYDSPEFEAPLVVRRPGFDRGQSARKTSRAGIIGSLVNG